MADRIPQAGSLSPASNEVGNTDSAEVGGGGAVWSLRGDVEDAESMRHPRFSVPGLFFWTECHCNADRQNAGKVRRLIYPPPPWRDLSDAPDRKSRSAAVDIGAVFRGTFPFLGPGLPPSPILKSCCLLRILAAAPPTLSGGQLQHWSAYGPITEPARSPISKDNQSKMDPGIPMSLCSYPNGAGACSGVVRRQTVLTTARCPPWQGTLGSHNGYFLDSDFGAGTADRREPAVRTRGTPLGLGRGNPSASSVRLRRHGNRSVSPGFT
ncbi:hypothetical protein COCON_G00177110 [Conger conger]|uniref:Uncharacterized protein n=1 Tax=Conger conger TaxID=82655 RepID=A0A9Q1D4Z7_CONCO|nr:hypothetical protein COCON_G00177110 [Conger conger]